MTPPPPPCEAGKKFAVASLFATPHSPFALLIPFHLFVRSKKKKGSGTPADVYSMVRMQAGMRGAPRIRSARADPPLAGRARLPAFHHGSCLAGFRPLGAAPGQASWDEAVLPTPFARWALPTPASPSPVTAPHASVVMPRSMMPRAARVRTANPPAGTALAPPPDMPPGGVLSGRDWPSCNYISDRRQ